MYADRVQETTTTTGTGTVTLAGAVSGFQTFTSAIPTGSTVKYTITDGTAWEVGEGSLLTTSTLSRTVVHSSSNSNALVNFSSGSKNVWVDMPASAVCDVGLTYMFVNKLVRQ